MEFKGTNGKWRINNNNGSVIDQIGRCVVDVSPSILISDKQSDANMRLISAAPDLLVAAKIGLGALEILGTFLEDAKLEANDYSIEIVKSALKKALG